MGRMLDYIDQLNELDTTGVEPMSHVFPVNNVFREDVVTNGDEQGMRYFANAPAKEGRSIYGYQRQWNRRRPDEYIRFNSPGTG